MRTKIRYRIIHIYCLVLLLFNSVLLYYLRQIPEFMRPFYDGISAEMPISTQMALGFERLSSLLIIVPLVLFYAVLLKKMEELLVLRLLVVVLFLEASLLLFLLWGYCQPFMRMLLLN